MSAYVVSEKSWAGVMLPGLAAATSSRQASRSERERGAHHVGVRRVGEVVGRRDVARLGRGHLEQAGQLDLTLSES